MEVRNKRDKGESGGGGEEKKNTAKCRELEGREREREKEQL